MTNLDRKRIAIVAAVAWMSPFLCIGGDLYGVCAHLSRPGEFTTRIEELTLMKEAGIGWCRTDFDWKYVEPKQGQWTFDHLDQLMAEAERIGVQMLPILDYEVPWASRPWTDEDIGKWRDYVRRLVMRYRGRCPVWEVWNEQNASQGGKHPSPSPKEYVALLKAAYEEIKSADPVAKVAIGGFSHVPFGYIEEVYKAGGGKCFDIMNVHPYQGSDRAERAMVEEYGKLRELMARYGDSGKPIWATEIGLRTNVPIITVKGLLRAALKNLDQARRCWRVLYTDNRDDLLAAARQLLPQELKGMGSALDTCRFEELETRLAAGGVDVLVFPFSEEYPADAMDAVCKFVKDGGTLVDFGGMAMFKPVSWKGRASAEELQRRGQRDRRRLRFDTEFWHTNSRIPKKFVSSPTVAFRHQWGCDVDTKAEVRCFKASGLEEGDEFLPLLSCETDGYNCVSMARIKYGGDIKGNVILAGFFERRFEPRTGEWQGKGCARQLNIAYALGYEKLFWYEFQQCSDYGIVRRKTFEPRPAYTAYKAFTTARPSGSVRDSGANWMDGDVCCPSWTRPDGRKAGAVWSCSGRGNAPAAAQGAAEYRDWLGRPLAGLPTPLPDTPVYYIGR